MHQFDAEKTEAIAILFHLFLLDGAAVNDVQLTAINSGSQHDDIAAAAFRRLCHGFRPGARAEFPEQ